MPTLQEYADSSKKSGYYVLANVGAPHPITLQVTSIAGRILEQTGYDPGDAVPTKLVWAMYDLDLLFTASSIDPDDVQDVSTDDILSGLDLGNRLTADEKGELLSYLEEYEGAKKETLTQLKREIEGSVTGTGRPSATDSGDTLDDTPPQNEFEAISFLYTTCGSPEEFRNAKQKAASIHLLQSVRMAHRHPHVDARTLSVEDDGGITYKLSSPDHRFPMEISDYQCIDNSDLDTDADFLVTIDDGGDSKAWIKDGEIAETDIDWRTGYDRQMLGEDSEWLLPPLTVDNDIVAEEGISEYGGYRLEPIRPAIDVDESDLELVEVDRISNSGNPVVEKEDGHRILDRGEPGGQYLIAPNRNGRGWKVLSRVSSDE